MEHREMKYRQGQVREFLDEGRAVEFTISDESKDRHRSVIPSDAWELDSFRGNPVAGWAHSVYGGKDWNPDNFIGRWENVRVQGGELVGELVFEDEETNPLAQKLYRKVRNGTINAVSVGFLPGGGHYGEEEEARGGKDETYYYTSAELVEVSLVGIPSNKNARKKALENGDIPELINDLVNEALGDKFSDEEIEKLTIKGLFSILRGEDATEVEEADTGEKVDTEAREKHKAKIDAYNNYLKLQKDYDTEREIRA
jgi:HK97 family phage prohead protease